MMWTAITRAVSSTLAACELQFVERQSIDLELARVQHRGYEACLESLGVQVISLPTQPELPDAVFVEDPAVVLDEIAIIARTGVLSRRAESESLAAVLSRFRPLSYLSPPATLEGGDVLRIGHTLFVGFSSRTNKAGVEQLTQIVEPLGYVVIPVEVRGCLHLKTAATDLGNQTILVNRNWIDTAPFRAFRLLDVAQNEPWAANTLRVGHQVLLPAGFDATRQILQGSGFQVCELHLSELMKAEAGPSCLSLLFTL